MTTSAEEAMARAKEIAARLSGSAVDTTTTTTTTTTTKRKRWGVSADAADSTGTSNAADILPGLSDVAKKLKAGDEPVQRRIWVSTANRPNAHFVKYFKDGDKLKGILDQIPASDKMSIDLKGRGTNPNPILGMPEEPLHVLIEGPPDLVSAAEPLVDKLVSEAESAPLLEDPSAIADKAADALAAAMDAAGNMPDSSAPGYRPAPVAALIHGNTGAAAGNGIYGPAGGGEMLEEQLGAPNGVVGYIIGRGGENITSMQSKTGCKVQIQKEHEMAPGQTQRIITLTATSKEAIDQCRAMIEEMVAERIRQTGSSVSMANAMATPGGGGAGTGGQAAKVHEAIAVGHQLVTMEVPDGEVGLIIGRAGSTIKSIQDRSGANIQIPPAADSNNSAVRTVSITHPHLEGAQMAKQIIEDILASSRSRPAQVPHVTIEVAIPDQDVGMCIGRGGCVVREMQNKTQTKIQIPSMSAPGATHRIATVTGPAEGCDQVKQMIERISLEQSSQSVMAGTVYSDQHGGGQYGGGQYGQQAYGQAAYGGGGGQQDYSAQWAAYYAAQGDAQAGGTAVSATHAPAPAEQQRADAYYEQFFRYAYYYGEEAARKYYGAWSPPEGTPNPYGTNPAGITAAPPAATASDGTTQPAAYDGSSAPPQSSAPATSTAAATESEPAAAPAARETSRRGVSNLPAWMTKGQG